MSDWSPIASALVCYIATLWCNSYHRIKSLLLFFSEISLHNNDVGISWEVGGGGGGGEMLLPSQ